jgi:hypothetical protein
MHGMLFAAPGIVVLNRNERKYMAADPDPTTT